MICNTTSQDFINVDLANAISFYYENNASVASKFTIFLNAVLLAFFGKSLANKEKIEENRALWYEKLEWAFSN